MSSSALFTFFAHSGAVLRSPTLEGAAVLRRLASRNPLISTQTATCQVRIFRINALFAYSSIPYTGSVRIDSELGGVILPGVALVGDAGTSAGLSEIVEFKVAAALDYTFVYLPTAADITAGVALCIEVVV